MNVLRTASDVKLKNHLVVSKVRVRYGKSSLAQEEVLRTTEKTEGRSDQKQADLEDMKENGKLSRRHF